jgi:hypothetical protein
MHDLEALVNYANAFAEALQTGFDKFVASYPLILKQQLKVIASRKLNTTKDTYINSIQSKMASEYVLVIELDPKQWLPNVIEKGVEPFDMKEGHLKSPKAKISKEGFKYLVIPMGKDKSGGSASDNPKSQDLRERIRSALVKPKFGGKKMKLNMDGSVQTTEAVLTNDPAVKGLYRVRQFKDSSQAATGKGGKTSYVMFRVMSEKPGTSTWQHPGLKPLNAFRDLEVFINQTAGPMLETMLQQEISKI